MLHGIRENTLGKMTFFAGIAALLTSASVIIGATLLLAVGDLMDVVNSALLIPLFAFLGATMQNRSATLGRFVQWLGAAGALIRMVGALLIFARVLSYEDGVLLVSTGMGLMGIALLLYLLATRARLVRRRGYYLFSLVVGFAMALNILSFILNDAITPLLQGDVGFGDVNPLLLVVLAFAPIFLLGFPIWLLWTGRLLSRAPDYLAVQPEAA